MNQMIEAIFQARAKLARETKYTSRLVIRANPAVTRALIKEKDDTGRYYSWVDAFDKSKWAICGLPLIEDESIDGWIVEAH